MDTFVKRLIYVEGLYFSKGKGEGNRVIVGRDWEERKERVKTVIGLEKNN